MRKRCQYTPIGRQSNTQYKEVIFWLYLHYCIVLCTTDTIHANKGRVQTDKWIQEHKSIFSQVSHAVLHTLSLMKKIYLISEVWGDLMTIWRSKSEGSCCNPYCIKQLWKSHALHFIHNSPSKSVSKPSFFKISNSLNLLISNSPFFNKPFFSPKTSVLFSDETRLSHVWRDMYLAWEVLSG